jgi:type VI secretion system secreted protein Hcp
MRSKETERELCSLRKDSDSFKLSSVLIGNMDQVGHEGTALYDSFSLKFSKVKWKYCQQKIAGGAGGNTQGGWDLSTNRIA